MAFGRRDIFFAGGQEAYKPRFGGEKGGSLCVREKEENLPKKRCVFL